MPVLNFTNPINYNLFDLKVLLFNQRQYLGVVKIYQIFLVYVWIFKFAVSAEEFSFILVFKLDAFVSVIKASEVSWI
jgi:hypothetical protein